MNGTAALPRQKFIRRDDARRCLVDAAAAGLYRIVDLYRLFDMGCISGNALFFGNCISPFYSPSCSVIRRTVGSAPSRLVARLASIFPSVAGALGAGGISLTCYYYRGAYYKAFWADPPACTVGEPRKTYLGERSFPLIMQNVHRYFLYLALIFIVILTIDVWKALWFAIPQRTESWDRVGTIVLAINVILLSGYTFGVIHCAT
jgi:hypothetical protein